VSYGAFRGNLSADRLPSLDCSLEVSIQALQNLLDVFDECPASFGRRDKVVVSPKDFKAYSLFTFPHLAAEGGLGYIQLFRCFAEV
jgi:hypothetical protein